MDIHAIQDRLAQQSGVISRQQVLHDGGRPADIARLIRRREWVRTLDGVYLDHTGEPTWLQRCWVGVVFHWPAALAGMSAIRATVGPGWRLHDDRAPIEIAVPQRRHVVPQPGYLVRRPNDFFARVQWNASPPRIRIDHAGVDVASRQPDRFSVVGVLADLCQTRRTAPPRLLDVVAGRGRIAQRPLLNAVLTDIANGTCSVLEREYLHQIEVPHGLPRPTRQRRRIAPGVTAIHDVEYDDLGLVVELDGRLFHDSATQRDRDLERDLVTAVAGADTVRLGWGQLLDRPCLTTVRLAQVLRAHGWTGTPLPCGPSCALTGVRDASGASYTPVVPRRAS